VELARLEAVADALEEILDRLSCSQLLEVHLGDTQLSCGCGVHKVHHFWLVAVVLKVGY
jgi:hypothetical protein